LQITEDRKKQVIDLYFNQHKTYAEIAEIERISPRDNTCYHKRRRSQTLTEQVVAQARKRNDEGSLILTVEGYRGKSDTRFASKYCRRDYDRNLYLLRIKILTN
jgi:hypothetical protein